MSAMINPSYYTVSDFQKIMFEGSYTLNEETLAIIQYLENNIIIPPESTCESVTSSTPIRRSYEGASSDRRNVDARSVGRNKRSSNGSSRMSGNGFTRGTSIQNNVNSAEWDTIRTFKTTKMEVKEGVEKQINDIRILLNKISSKNYDVQKDVLIEQIAAVLSVEDGENDNRKRIATTIFDIASANKFMSELYADLYAELVAKMSIFDDVLVGLVDRYRETIHQIHYVDPNTDYDGFCQYNKANDLRKAMAAFIVNLMKRGLITQDCVLELICEFQELSRTYMDTENHTNEVDEITENVAVLITMAKSTLVEHEMWKSRVAMNIQEFTKMKAKDHVSLSSRVVFKYMDL